MYRVEFSELAKFDRLNRSAQERIIKKLVEVRAANNLYRFFEPLRSVLARKAMAGNYRIIADIDIEQFTF